jgi:hypothetical protein
MEMSLDCRLQRTAKPSGPCVGQYHGNYVLGCGVVKVFRRYDISKRRPCLAKILASVAVQQKPSHF